MFWRHGKRRYALGLTLVQGICVLAVSGALGGSEGQSNDEMAARPEAAATSPFLVFDDIHLRRKPDLVGEYGATPIQILYEWKFFGRGEDRQRLPRERRVRWLAARCDPSILVSVDIESWNVLDAAQRPESIAKYRQVVLWMKDESPGLRIGIYGKLPLHPYGLLGPEPDAEKQKTWEHGNRELTALAEVVDVILPSLYVHHDDMSRWRRRAELEISAARQYEKPIYPYLRPYIENQRMKIAPHRPSVEFWRLQLETCHELADGVVIWEAGEYSFDATEPWWTETVSFLDQIEAGREMPSASSD